MLGFNGGLMGVRRTPTNDAARGVWFQNEQSVAKRAGIWYGDPNWTDVSALLPMTGSNGSTTFTDSSSNNFSITANGGAQISTTQSKFGGGSGSFNGTNGYLSAPSSTAFSFGTGDFTVEAWVYLTSQNLYSAILEIGNHVNTTGVVFLIGSGASGSIYSGAFYGARVTATLNTWLHVAYVRSSGNLLAFENGSQIGSTVPFTNNLTNTSTVSFGYAPGVGGADYYLAGYGNSFRVTKGVARYTSNFTAPTEPFPVS